MLSLSFADLLLKQLHCYLAKLSGIENKGNGAAIKRWMTEYLEAYDVPQDIAKAIVHFQWDKALAQGRITLDSLEFMVARLGLKIEASIQLESLECEYNED